MQKIFSPVLAPIIRSRWEALAISVAAVLHVALITVGLPGWQCPIKAITGVPCPGCFLGTAISLLLKGKLQQSLVVHAFAPVVVLGVGFIGVASLLPDTVRLSVVQKTAEIEQRTGITAIILFGLLFYWSLRLFWFGFG